ncbi:non-ribosomal peptide synthetase [Enhygromyxa salina]|uniref:Chondramide synthase cmdD n=1 Tax=Enhygromyxa salina TaxID=215803 RepID=A0A2S9Y5S9_9BACT|nr:non-ribosomal peptide synthetase [Enhygromyxa salina]PRQ00460.1 Chondramide synthase cmdD [Enhygromyxa salina]
MSVDGWTELSPQQRRLWLRVGEDAPPTYARVELSGSPDPAALQSVLRPALEHACRTHAQLGVTVAPIVGMQVPVQVPRSTAPALAWAVEVLPDSEADRDRAWAQFLADARFVGQGPALRATLMTHPAHAGAQLWVAASALLLDAPSLLVILQSLGPAVAGDPPTSFAHYTSWQRALLHDDAYAAQRHEDEADLRDALDHQRSQARTCPAFEPGPGTRSVRHVLDLSPSLRARLVSECDADLIAAEALVLTAWRTTLGRRLNRSSLSLGRVTDGRVFPELHRCVGLLASTCLTRVPLPPAERFFDLCDDAEVELERQPLPVLDARAFDDARVALGFRFVARPRPWDALGCRWRVLDHDDACDSASLSLACVWDHASGPALHLLHDPDRIGPELAAQIGAALVETLARALAGPTEPIATFPRMSAPEREQVSAWTTGQPATAGSEDLAFVHERVAKAAARAPDTIALEDEHGQLSYAALMGRVHAWAWMLRERGVGPESIVGLYLERRVDALVAQLAVLTAGGAFMALDERAPPARVAQLVAGVEPTLVLSHRSLRGHWPDPDALDCIDEAPWSTAAPRRSPPRSRLHPANAAYVLHTSGSTGTPRPVVVTHRAFSSYVSAVTERLELPPRPRAVLLSTLAADLGHTAIWPTLTRGGSLFVPAWTRLLDPTGLARAIEPRGIDLAKIVPSHLDALLAGGELGLVPRSHLVVGGEAARPGLLSALAAQRPALRLFNHYGPTETTVGAIAGELEPGRRDTPPLGRPLAGMHTPVLDPAGDPCPLGCRGELHLGGVQVARGYRGRPGSTASRFVPDPAGHGARMYRSGDLAQLDPSGALVFLGRVDTQLKIRGHRVEPGELVQALRELPDAGIREAVVESVEGPGGARLVAYLGLDVVAHQPGLHALAQEQVGAWRAVFDTTHGQLDPEPGVTFNAFGWDSSYTGEQLPDAHIREQVGQTVARIRGLAPTRALELGCGTGLLLFELAGGCARYLATDFSPDILAYTRAVLASLPDLGERVELRELGSDALAELGEERFDTIILNSVIQYFPSVEYLLDVLTELCARVEPGGRLFIGDVRDLRLLDPLHASIELFRATPDTRGVILRQRVAQRRHRERELLLDVEFWRRLGDWIPGITGVEIGLKRGRWHNELTRARYDVVVHVGGAPPVNLARDQLDQIDASTLSLEALDHQLQRTASAQPAGVVCLDVRDARISAALRTLELLDAEPTLDATALRQRCAAEAGPSVDPEALARLAEGHGYAVALRPGPRPGYFDAVLTRGVDPGCVPELRERAPGSASDFASTPLLDELAARQVSAWREALAQRLPDYMVPDAFVVLPRLPLTVNGKLDRARLPAPSFGARAERVAFVAPRNRVESEIAAVWREVLQVDEIGVHDDFFELGGHSLLATQVVVRIRAKLDSSLPLTHFFDGAPTIARLAALIDASEVDEARAGPSLTAIATAEAGAARGPLAHAQARMLFDPDPAHPFHNIPFAFFLDGALDRAALVGALDLVLARHAAWRTVFELGATPADSHQRVRGVDEAGGFPLTQIDLRGQPDAIAEAQAIAEREGQRRFDLSQDLPVRGVLIQLQDQLHVLVLVVHHIVSDGWSTGVFCAEVSHSYASFRRGQPPTLPTLEVHYRDYASWQHQCLAQGAREAQLAYWIEQLDQRELELALPTDFPRPERQTWRGTGIAVALPDPVTRAAEALASARGASLFMVLLTVYLAELHLLSGQRDIGVGTPVANRTRVELEGLLGCFINLLVMQVDLDGDPSFAALLARVRSVCVGAYDHQDAPFHELIEALGLEHPGLARPPLFQVMFELANVPGERRLQLDGLELRGLDFSHGTSEFELNLILQKGDDGLGLGGWLLYRTDLYTQASAEALFDGFVRLLAAVIEDDSLPLSSYRDCLPTPWPAS